MHRPSNNRNLLVPLTGAVALGIFIGACARDTEPTADTNLQREVQAQIPTGGDINAATGNTIRNATDVARLSASYSAIAKRVTPAVVNINTRTVVPGRVLRDPFGGVFGDDAFREPDRESSSLGSGVIVDSKGVIITNNHVVEGASTITVTLNDKRRFTAKLIGTDPDTDVAVLKINAPGPLPTVRWANSDQVQVGDIVLAIGSPFGLTATVTQGIISAKDRRDLDLSRIEDFLQTDAAINPGNSGGALVDINGNLVGINTAILSRTGGNQGIGLAIPAKLAQRISGQLLASGSVTRGWIGIGVDALDENTARQVGFNGANGLIVTGVHSRGPAARLDWVRDGANIITSVNGQAVNTPGELRNLITEAAPGTTLKLEVWQDGRTRTFDVPVVRQPPIQAARE